MPIIANIRYFAWQAFVLAACLAVPLVPASLFPPPAAAGSAWLVSPFTETITQAAERYERGRRDLRPAPPDRPYLGGICPHHDLALPMILRFYERLASGRAVKRVWLFAPDHFRRARRYVAVCDTDWKLSPKTLPADSAACEGLAALRIVETNPALFAREHGITLHIPLIARYFPDASVVPIVLAPDIPDMALLILKNKMLTMMDEGDIVLLSMDLSHYKTPEGMSAEDARTLPALTGLKVGVTGALDVDARRAAALVLRLFRDMGARSGALLERRDSSYFLGHRIESGTSYATITYTRE